MMYKKQKSCKKRIVQISRCPIRTPFFVKKSFSILEIIALLAIIALVITLSVPKYTNSKLQSATDKIALYLHYTRYIALVDNQYGKDDNEWEKKRWSLKFQKCSDPKDGLYFVVFSDKSGGTGAFKKDETLKDPLNNKYLYSGYDCIPSVNESKNILLTKEFGIQKVEVSCNTTSTIGQLSFGHDGKIYSQLGMNIKEITQPCIITLYDNTDNYKQIKIESNTGYIHKL